MDHAVVPATPLVVPIVGTVEREIPRVALYTAAATDEQLIEVWLRTKRSSETRRAYRRDVRAFLDFAGVPMHGLVLDHVLAYADYLATPRDGEEHVYRASTQARKLSCIKSLLTFAQRAGYLTHNVGAAVTGPAIEQRLAERILPEAQVQRMIALEPEPRNHALIRLSYATGGRVSEVCRLKVRNLSARMDAKTGREAGQVTLFGKGGKTRAVPVSPDTWANLQTLIRDSGPDDPVFRSRKSRHNGKSTGGHISPSHAWRIVRTAALRAGIAESVSPHWLRHAHASHALDRGAPLHLVRDTLGHSSISTTDRYTHARRSEGSSQYLPV